LENFIFKQEFAAKAKESLVLQSSKPNSSIETVYRGEVEKLGGMHR